MLAIAPDVFDTPHFAMKGGTAINMFVQDLPRLSVDIDVVMCSHEPGCDEALAINHDERARARQAIERQGHIVTVAAASGRKGIVFRSADNRKRPDIGQTIEDRSTGCVAFEQFYADERHAGVIINKESYISHKSNYQHLNDRAFLGLLMTAIESTPVGTVRLACTRPSAYGRVTKS